MRTLTASDEALMLSLEETDEVWRDEDSSRPKDSSTADDEVERLLLDEAREASVLLLTEGEGQSVAVLTVCWLTFSLLSSTFWTPTASASTFP